MDFWLIVVIAFAAAVVIGFGIVILRGRADAVRGPSVPASSGTTTEAAAVLDQEALDTEVGKLLAEGDVIPAVKLIRENTGFGLRESMRYVARLQAGADAAADAPAGTTRSSVPSDAMAHIQQLVAQGKKIQAVKELREHTGLSLREAKTVVDRMADGATVAGLDLPTAGPQLPPSPPPLPDEVMARVRVLAAQGKKISAIKELRDHTPGLGLKEAKDIVEGL